VELIPRGSPSVYRSFPADTVLSNLSRSYLVKHEDAGCGTSSEGTLDEEESHEDVCLYDSEHSNGELLN
jgi:hypothetical protein